MARLAGDEVEGLDEEFLFHVNRGSELLLEGRLDHACASFERALELRSKDAKALGLLGQAYYKLSRFEEAAGVWKRLVDDNPVEPSARVNLGLACLKAKRYPDAIKQLEIALDLNGQHKKAMGYLGLALLESGDAARAREWFRKAGSDQMVARCEELLASRGPSPRATFIGLAAVPAGARDAPPAASPAVPSAAADIQSPVASIVEAAAQAEAQLAEDAEPPAPEPLHAPSDEPEYHPPAAGSVLGAWAAARIVEPAPGEIFSISGGTLSVEVRGELRIRLDGLFATRGKVTMAGEMKRFRGRATGKPFGEGASRMRRVSGNGVLLYQTQGRCFSALDLGPDAAYLREEILFGFEDGLAFENGRVPSALSELNLVHLRGRGRFLLATVGEPVSVDVAPKAPLKVPLVALVGWLGGLTPRICPLLDEPEEAVVVAVELIGEGRVLVDSAAGFTAGVAEG